MSKRTISIFIIMFVIVLGITTAISHYFVHPPPLGSYLGNSNSHILHTINCSSGAKTKEGNGVYFDNIGDALRQGYRPCKICNPR